jgi:hypothetical protein
VDASGIWIILGFSVVAILAYFVQASKLSDSSNLAVIYLGQLQGLTQLNPSGTFLVRTLRQSGNLQQDDRVFESRDAALNAALSTFKRAKIDSISLVSNTPDLLHIQRAFYGHRGSGEGKKVGTIIIQRTS